MGPVKVDCPKCHVAIPLDDINVAKDIALCRSCEQTFSFAELSQDQAVPEADPSRPPRGAWYRSQGNEMEVGATTRSAAALFLVPFVLFWSGASLGGIYGRQIARGKFELGMSLFGIPFLLGSLVLIPVTLMAICGKVVVRSSGDQAALKIGVGPIGWTRTFRWSDIKSVRMSETSWKQNGRSQPLIELEGPAKPMRFGSGLTTARRDFLFAILRRRVRNRF